MGDGILDICCEECDDGNTDNGDGCDQFGRIEMQPYTSLNSGTNITITGTGTVGDPYVVNSSDNIDDADADPANEIQTLSWDETTNTLSLSEEGGSVVIPANSGFMAVKTVESTINDQQTIIFDEEVFDFGANYDPVIGEFTATTTGLYQFNVTATYEVYNGASTRIALFVDGVPFSTISQHYTYGPLQVNSVGGSITMYLMAGQSIDIRHFGSEETLLGIGASTGLRYTIFTGHKIQ